MSRSFTNGVVSTYQYSPTRGWVENIHAQKDTTVHQDLAYQYYPDGMIQSVTSAKSMESWNYAYDDLNRLLSATNVDTPSLTQSFTYDEIGNITYNSQIGTYTYPATGNPRPHAVSAAGSRTYQYNAAGQMTNRNGTIIQWNGDGKPSSIGNVGFTYDGVGTRLKKVSGGQTTKYVGGDYEIAPDGTVTKYLLGGKQVGTSFFIHHQDHLGSIQAVTDAAGGEVRRQKHKPFGDQHYAWGSHLESKGWIGEREEETELLYLNARFYDPELARFVSPDPVVRFGQKLNRYSYALNAPTVLSDPSGLDEGCTTSSTSNSTSITCPADPRYTFLPLTIPLASLISNGYGMDPSFRVLQEQDALNNSVTEAISTESQGQANGNSGSTDGPSQDTSAPDNPLYNCQNGLKTNCPGNRSGEATTAGTTTPPCSSGQIPCDTGIRIASAGTWSPSGGNPQILAPTAVNPFQQMSFGQRAWFYFVGTNKFIPGLFHPSFWGKGVPLSVTTGVAGRAAANTLGTNTILDAFSSVRTFVPALRQGLVSASAGWITAAAGFEGGVALISFFQAGGDELAWYLFPDPD